MYKIFLAVLRWFTFLVGSSFVNMKGERIPCDPLMDTGALQQPLFFGRERSDKYGPLYVVWDLANPVLVIANQELAKEFYANHLKHERTPSFSILGSICEGLLGRAIGTAYDKGWAKHRKAFKHDFITKVGINERSSMIHEECSQWANNLQTGSFQALSSLNRFTLRILAKVVYGSELATQYQTEIDNLAFTHEVLMERMGSVFTRLPFSHKIPTETNRLLKQFQEDWRLFNHRLFQETSVEHSSVVAALKKQMETEGSLTEEEILHDLDEILFFNIDVMYSAIGGLFANLAKNPFWQEQVAAEVSTVLQGVIPGNITERHLKSMKILNAFIQESARVSPSLALSFPETVPEECQIGGYRIPKGTIVLMDAFSINNDPQHWPQPDVFNPARFLQNSPSDAKYHRFGLGLRRCLGQHYAETIIQSVLAQTLLRVKIHTSSNEQAVGVRQTGLPFFTPFLSFPAFELRPHASRTEIRLNPCCFDSKDAAFSTGLEILHQKGTVLCGISLANSYYTQEGRLAAITQYFQNRVSQFFPFTPSMPSIHTYKAKGSKDAVKKVARDYKHLKKLTDTAQKKAEGGLCRFRTLSWDNDIEVRPEYKESLEEIHMLYISNPKFQKDVRATSRLVVEKAVKPENIENAIDEAKEFLLEELAFLKISPRLLGVESVAYVYHMEWPIFNKLINGVYDTERVKNVGYLIVSPPKADDKLLDSSSLDP